MPEPLEAREQRRPGANGEYPVPRVVLPRRPRRRLSGSRHSPFLACKASGRAPRAATLGRSFCLASYFTWKWTSSVWLSFINCRVFLQARESYINPAFLIKVLTGRHRTSYCILCLLGDIRALNKDIKIKCICDTHKHLWYNGLTLIYRVMLWGKSKPLGKNVISEILLNVAGESY